MVPRWLVFFWHLVTAKGWWCQASPGSCIGQRHKFQKDETFKTTVRPLLQGDGSGSYAHGLASIFSDCNDDATLRFADWDSDGDMDVLVTENNSLWLYERLLGDVFEKHKLISSHVDPIFSSWRMRQRFEVADWDGDKRPDILMCEAYRTVRFLSHSVVLAGVSNISDHPAILETNRTEFTDCDMQAVDFDEDGDLDLVVSKGKRYFERVSDGLEERTGEQNPLQAFAGQVEQIADLDGDGLLDVLVAVSYENICRWRYFRRTAAGTLIEPLENPLAEMQFGCTSTPFSLAPESVEIHVADWNSDGLPDVLFVETYGKWLRRNWKVGSYYRHVVDRDLWRNSHFNMYEDIHLSPLSSFVVHDWNEDGFEDLMVVKQTWGRWNLRRYEFQPRAMKEVPGFSVAVNRSYTRNVDYLSGFALVDWDRDGALDLLIASEADGKLHFYPNLGEEIAEHPFKKIELKKDPYQDQVWIFAKPMVVDWDNDGDLDLFLGPPDGRYFEHLADGSLHEKQSPLVGAMQSLPPNPNVGRRRRAEYTTGNWQFLDCDADGDLDLIQIPDSFKAPAQACEHDDGTHELRCDPDFLCLGTNVSQYPGGAADGVSFFSVSDVQLKLFVQRASALWGKQSGIELWTPGFCMPSDLCNNKGRCFPGELHCRCNPGYEAADCSSCQEHYYSVRRQELQVQDCKACPGDVAGGKVCYGRGTCFDDVMAKRLQQESTAAWMAIGNGSCDCTEAHFYGTDQDGRSACVDGHCPAGTEEIDGSCSSCAGGSFSAVGGRCQECEAGKVSRRGSANCSSCSAGRVSRTWGSSTCEPCPAGTYESENKFCKACPRGTISGEGSAACSPCEAGRFAKDGVVCEACPNGTISVNGSSECQSCRAGTYSDPGSNICSDCPAGAISKVPGSVACQPCAAGTYAGQASANCKLCPRGTISREGSGACSPCEAGRFTRESRMCEQCPGGTISANGSSECRSCPAGKYSRAGSSSCSECPGGAISQVAGSSACEACPAGTYEINRQVCNACPQGEISSEGNAACSPCEAGRFAKEALMCEQCPNGTISSAGRSECHSCPRGTYSDPGSNTCSQCSAGTISKVPGSTECWQCAAGTFSAAGSSECPNCPAGKFSEAGSTNCSECPTGEISRDPGSIACEACPAGKHEVENQFCNLCQQGTISVAGSGTCSPCNDLLVRAIADATRQTCQVDAMEIVLGLICWMTAACFCFLSLTGCFGRLPIADVSSQGDKWVITTSIAHHFLKRAHPLVSFAGTEVPNLDSTSKWKVRALSSYQLTLHGEQASIPLDTSTGHIRLNFPHPFLCMGMWRCPLLGWCLFFAAATAGLAGRLMFSLTALACGVGFCTGLLAFAFRRRQGEKTPLTKRRRQFLTEWPLAPARCDRGPDRSMTAGQLLDFLQFFDSFIKERSMYYVCSNIVKPLTEPVRLSFVELIGPTKMQWFVSHYWGMPVRHFSDAIRKHAQCCEGDWKNSAYWICTFSNSQWDVKAELGHGKWQESSFYLALRSPDCQGTTMIIDDNVLPLQRIWCLFEVYQTISLSQSECFQGLLLCTSAGVLQKGNAGTDVAVAVAKTVADLDTRTAKATEESDRLMIHALIESMPGGFDAMNTFVRTTICKALEASHLHYETTLKSLMQNLTSQVAPSASLPTLLTSSARRAEEVPSTASDFTLGCLGKAAAVVCLPFRAWASKKCEELLETILELANSVRPLGGDALKGKLGKGLVGSRVRLKMSRLLILPWLGILVEGGCTSELLRAEGGNYYRLIEGEEKITCSELTDGKCPVAVPALGYPCLVSCVESVASCASVNPQTPGVNKWKDPDLCTSCDVTACKFCDYPHEDGPARCNVCFEGFELVQHADGTQECVVWGQGAIILVAYVLMFIIVALIMLILLGTCYVAARESMKKMMHAGTTANLEASLIKASYSEKSEATMGEQKQSPQDKKHNEKAISQGFMTSLQASIKFESLRRAGGRGERGVRRLVKATMDNEHEDLGIGLQLFYNTQLFLIVFSLLGLATAYLFLRVLSPGPSLTQLVKETVLCPTSAEELRQIEATIVQREHDRAKMGQFMGVAFWFASVVLSLGFHYYQKNFQKQYDSSHQTADDYTLMLEGVPPECTSERRLHRFIEKELNMEGRIYGVCIMYDLMHLSHENQEKLEEMLEHIIELDDLKNGWVKSDFSMTLKALEEDVEKDKEEFKEILKTMKCCGRAYIVFHTQVSMVRVLRERRGLRKQILFPQYASVDGEEGGEIDMAALGNRGDQPDGIRYEKAEMTEAERRKTYLILPARQFVYILIYIVVAQLFYMFMQKPWDNCALEASAGAAGVQLAAKGVLLVNFAIQTAVAFDVEGSCFLRIAKVDQMTFIFNTLLMAITLGYAVVQECNKNGLRSVFLPPEEELSPEWWQWRRGLVHSAAAEVNSYEALVSVFTEQTIMLYVLGEVGNVIGPVAFFWFALRAVFISNIGGSAQSRVQKFLRMMLPKTRNHLVLTAREAEKAQMLVPLLLWMEYTYCIIFPGIALTAFYFIDFSLKIWTALLSFSVLFFLWQRYVMLWLYGKSQFDSEETYFAFIIIWGVVLSKTAASFALWAYRLQEITEWPFALLIFVLIFLLTFFLYLSGILYIEWLFGKEGKNVDDMDNGAPGHAGDPGYDSIIETTGISWWNVNPIYVLKQRLCPNEPGFEVHDARVMCWPAWSDQGFFEKGKEFRHRRHQTNFHHS
eukprot:s1118_g21.t1